MEQPHRSKVWEGEAGQLRRELGFLLGTLHVVSFFQFLENVSLENSQTVVTASRHFAAAGHSKLPLGWD